jgi:20S proteasome subunit alpha 6
LALKESLSQDKELTVDNTSLGVSGIGENFHLYEGQEVAEYLETTFENKGEEQEQSGEGMEVDDS